MKNLFKNHLSEQNAEQSIALGDGGQQAQSTNRSIAADNCP